MTKKAGLIILFLLLSAVLHAQLIPELTFRNQPLSVVLLTLAEQADVQIIYDSTVTGNVSFYFSPMKLEKGLTLLLDTYDYYFWEENDVYYVSKIRVLYNEKSKLMSVDSEDVDILKVISRISEATNTTILKDPLPRDTSSLHIKDMPLKKVLEIITTKLTDYELQALEDYFYIKKLSGETAASNGRAKKPQMFTKTSSGLYSVNTENKRFKELIENLFTTAGIEYSVLGRNDSVVPRFSFENKSFEEILSLLMEQGDADYAAVNGIYYIFDLDRRDTIKKYNTLIPITLQWIEVENVPSLFPPGLANSNNYRLDKNTNTIFLYGTPSQIKPIEQFIRMIDIEGPPKDYLRMELKKIKSTELKSMLPAELKGLDIITIPNTNIVIFDVQPQKRHLLMEFLAAVDDLDANEPVSLKYINAEKLLEKLPPSVSKDDIVTTADPALIFFKGPAESRAVFLEELSYIDNPVSQIRYDIMVIEYSIDNTTSWKNSDSDDTTVKYSTDPESDSHALDVVGSFKDLLSLDFDLVTNFGLEFSQNLSYKLANNQAKVLTNTRLVGISGESLKFQSTNTSRFRLYEYDTDTGDQIPGSTKEVTSGLIIQLTSWASGEKEITMEISATYSKQDTPEGDDLPSTSEKVVTSHVRTQSGEPVTISGLYETYNRTDVTTVPVIGKIPLLGKLFTKESTTQIDREMVIYILPVIEGGIPVDNDEIMGKYYKNYFASGE